MAKPIKKEQDYQDQYQLYTEEEAVATVARVIRLDNQDLSLLKSAHQVILMMLRNDDLLPPYVEQKYMEVIGLFVERLTEQIKGKTDAFAKLTGKIMPDFLENTPPSPEDEYHPIPSSIHGGPRRRYTSIESLEDLLKEAKFFKTNAASDQLENDQLSEYQISEYQAFIRRKNEFKNMMELSTDVAYISAYVEYVYNKDMRSE